MPKSYSMGTESAPGKQEVQEVELTTFSENGNKTARESNEDGGPKQMVSAGELFRFATLKDKLLMFFGTIGAFVHGISRPILMVLFGSMADLFIDDSRLGNIIDAIMPNLTAIYPNITREWIYDNPDKFIDILYEQNATDLIDIIQESALGDLFDQMIGFAVYYAVAGCVVIIAAYFQIGFWQTAAFNQCQKIRNRLVEAILHQDIAWFDTHEVGELNSRIAEDVDQIEAGIGDKLSIVFQHLGTFIAGFVIAFVYGWKLALVILALVPLMAFVGLISNRLGTKLARREMAAYARAGAVAEEVLGSIRTVVAFGGQQREIARYEESLLDGRKSGMQKGVVGAIALSLIFFVLFGSYALAFWYGTDLVSKNEMSPGDMLTVFFSMMIGGFSIGNAMPNLQDFANSRGAAYAIYKIIDLVPSIDSSSDKGEKPKDLKGNVHFNDVHFEYPARIDIPVLKGLTMTATVGQTVALVGASGCGKSTTIQLLQRFYDPKSGQVLIDGRDIRDYNIKWLRQHIGVVSQEPVLFGTSISENIRFGREDVSMEEMVKAAKMANAHDFICKLPQKYETVIGERGTQLSGGQKQRVAIARALVRDPRILLLDEATSALDTESEASVQEALDRARLGRTTFVVAHRLSTIKTADVIFAFKDGVVVEKGSHEDLMQYKDGIYYKLVTNQTMKSGDDDIDTENEVLDEDDMPELKRNGFDRHSSKRLLNRALSIGSNASSMHPEDMDEVEFSFDFKRILRMNAPEWHFLFLGCIGAVIAGGIQPASAVLYTEILSIFDELDPEIIRQEGTNLALIYIGIGALAALGQSMMFASFSRAGEFLTMRMRKLAFQSMIRQDMSFFDDLKNSTGALCTRLSSDASLVRGATGSRLSLVLQSIASLGAGIVIGMVYSWQLALLVLAFIPPITFAGAVGSARFIGKKGEDGLLEESGKIAVEAFGNIRTVAALTKEEHFATRYGELTASPYQRKRKAANLQAFGYSVSFGMIFFCYAATYTLGAYLIEDGTIEYKDMFRVVAAMVFGAQGAGTAVAQSADFRKAKAAAVRLFALFDLQPLVICSDTEGRKLDRSTGNIELTDVRFNYPTRPNIRVLRGLSFMVKPGSTVALVGSSGCGKSTVVQLIERFYDPLKGSLAMDSHNIRDLNLPWLRSQMSIVSQEPTLFDCSIRENIAYGDNTRTVNMDEIIDVARSANIHSFIESLPMGYETNVGNKGTQLSGGQKQRVAIARALIRNPKLLLLDEATSALDTESEKVVQEALERAQQGRTSIVIAHRLSTIQNADCIIVIDKGRVAEMGTHAQLMATGDIYTKLNKAQLRDPDRK